MARKKHLINVHTSTGTTAPTGASLYLGEIAVQHTPNDPALWIKVGSAETSTEYEKFIGLTEITNMIQNSNILGSGYTYSGIPYVNSSTTIADAYSALTNEVIEDEMVTAAGFNDLNNRIKGVLTLNLNGETKGRYIPSADTTIDLDIVADNTLGSGYTYSGIPYVNSSTTIADAYSALTSELLKDELAISASLNDLNSRTNTLSGRVESIEDRIGGVLTLNVNGETKGYYTPSADTTIDLDIVADNTLGSGYTYSGIPYVNSSTTIADAYSALTSELLDDEEAIAASLNDLNDKIKGVLTVNVNGETAGQYIPSADTVLNLDVVTDNTLGSGYTFSGIPEVNSATTIPEAYETLAEIVIDDEEVTAAALNDLNDRIQGVLTVNVNGEEAGKYVPSADTYLNLDIVTDNTLGSGYTYSGIPYVNSATTIPDAYSALTKELINDEKVMAAALNDLNDRVQGVLTIQVNGVEQGQYVPSADTLLNLTVVQDVTGADVLLTGYELSSGRTEEELLIVSSDTVNDAFGKIQKQNIDNERVISEAFNDINTRLLAVEETSEDLSDEVEQLNDTVDAVDTTVQTLSSGLQALSGAVISNTGITALSAAVETNETNIEVLSAAVVELIVSGSSSDDLEALSAAVVDNEYVVAAALNYLNDRLNEIDISGITETDPIFVASPAYTITQADIDNWNQGGGGGEGAVTSVTINGTGNAVTDATFASKALTLTKGNVVTAQTQLSTAATGNGNVITEITVNDHQITKHYGMTVPSWATASTKPSYTASEVGALPTGTTLDNVADGTTRKLSNYATTGTVNTLNNTVTAHTANTTIHVTTAQTAAWDGKQDAIADLTTIRNNASSGASAYTGLTALSAATTAHTGNSDIHVTTTEKATWNGKANTSDITITGLTVGGTNATVTNKVAAVPTASTNAFGVIKTGDFLTNTNGTVKVNTGTTNTTVARGDQFLAVSGATTANTSNINTLSGATEAHTATTIANGTSSQMHLPTVSASDNGKILMVKNGAWSLETPVSIYTGSGTPNPDLGTDGDIYLQTS